MKKTISRGLILICFCFLWHSIVLGLLPEGSGLRRMCVHAPVGVIFSLSILKFLKTRFIDEVSKKIIFILMILEFFTCFYRSDMYRILDYLSFYGGMLGFLFLAKKAPISVRDIFNGIFFFGLPISLIGSILIPRYGLRIPYLTEYSYFLIGSAHYTGLLFSIFSLVSFILYLASKKKKYVLALIFGSVVVVFSLGRTELFALFISCAAYFFLFRYQKIFLNMKCIVLSITLFSIISIFFIPHILSNYKVDGFLGNRLKISLEDHDVTSGRSWLWNYHLYLFKKNFWSGSSEAELSFLVGDYIDGEKAKAGSESFFTYVLARDGIFSFVTLFFLIWLVWLPIRENNIIAFVIILMGLILTSGLSTLGCTYDIFGFLIYWAYFSVLFNPQQFPERNDLICSNHY
ncbi:hypothetical protein JWG39_11685 [Desulforhopalus vacuolatus]|uniref:hypothetical protein n=1 Tax=Desulforhopalus vacuolatus TaxID=40414 RepID=UPI0019623441|nr:hypothetical protein [Desulforhopalus vacuolatus]MBM9520475.1 hypothetical protein [Desulforhopalus vacuolatus]